MSFRTNTGKQFFLLSSTLLLSAVVRADGPPAPPSTNSPFVAIMIIIILILALAIALLANVLLGTAQLSADKYRKAQTPLTGNGQPAVTSPDKGQAASSGTM